MDTRLIEREIERLQKQVAELQRMLSNLPVRWGGGGSVRSAATQIEISSGRGGGGKYKAFLVDPPTGTLAYTGNLAASDLGTVTTAEITALNSREIGKSTVSLVAGSQTVRTFAMPLGNRDEHGKPCYLIIHAKGKQCTS
jgi:hypothetical protein